MHVSHLPRMQAMTSEDLDSLRLELDAQQLHSTDVLKTELNSGKDRAKAPVLGACRARQRAPLREKCSGRWEVRFVGHVWYVCMHVCTQFAFVGCSPSDL